MIRRVSLILAVTMLLTCSGCFWSVDHDHDRRGYDDRRDGYRHDDRRGHDDRR